MNRLRMSRDSSRSDRRTVRLIPNTFFRTLHIAAVTAIALGALAQPPAAAAPAANDTAPAASAITLPDLNPSEWFDGKMGGTFGAKTVTAFAKSNRVAVAGFRVVFVTHNEARAFVRASYLPGRDTGSARAKMGDDLKRG